MPASHAPPTAGLALPPKPQITKQFFRTTWRNKWLTDGAETIADMIAALREAADRLEAMQNDGVEAECSSAPDDYIFLETSDPAVAEKHGLELEQEEVFSGDDD